MNCLLNKVSELQKQLLELVMTLNLLLNVLKTNILTKLLLSFEKFSIYPFFHLLKFFENDRELLVNLLEKITIIIVFL